MFASRPDEMDQIGPLSLHRLLSTSEPVSQAGYRGFYASDQETIEFHAPFSCIIINRIERIHILHHNDHHNIQHQCSPRLSYQFIHHKHHEHNQTRASASMAPPHQPSCHAQHERKAISQPCPPYQGSNANKDTTYHAISPPSMITTWIPFSTRYCITVTPWALARKKDCTITSLEKQASLRSQTRECTIIGSE